MRKRKSSEKAPTGLQVFSWQVDKYTWVDYGSSYLPSELNAAYLWGTVGGGGQDQ